MASNASPLLGFDHISLGALPPLALYIHIPWCVRKCPYCDFNSHAVRPADAQPVRWRRRETPLPTEEDAAVPGERRYVDALIADLDAALPQVWGRRLHAIFFGGGTPSLFSAESVDAILSAVRARLIVESDAEITLEANPGTVEAGKFAGFRAAGVNRLSLGIQSFDDERLQALGRIHDAHEARRAIEIAQRHFDNVNLDLMYALPAQTLDACRADVAAALAFGTAHLSLYHLTLEPHTLFHRFPPALPDEEAAADMQDAIEEALAAAGYEHYETSAHAQPGRQCRHNLNYWRFGDYLGIGAGAHGKLSFPDRIVREMRHKQPAAYMAAALRGSAVQEAHAVPARELPFEFAMNVLRLREGFSYTQFAERTGLPMTAIVRRLEAAEAKGLVERDHLRVRPTVRGRRFLNDLLTIFLDVEPMPASGDGAHSLD